MPSTTSTPQRPIPSGADRRGPGPGRRRHRPHDPAVRAGERHDRIGVPHHRPAQLVDGSMVSAAQRDQVVEVRRTTLDPVLDMVDVRELGEGASGEPTPLVAPSDLDPLGHRRFPSGPTLVEDGAVRSLHGEDDAGVARQPARHLGGDRADTLNLGDTSSRAAQEEFEGCVHHDTGPGAASIPRLRRTFRREQLHQRVVQTLVVRHVPQRIGVLRRRARLSAASSAETRPTSDDFATA